MTNIYPTREGVAAIKEVTAAHTPADLVGTRVALLTTFGMAFHGLLENVNDEGTLTMTVTEGYNVKKFHVPADQVKSCKQILFENRRGKR